jgi:DNA-binding IclR family transcriptional regulator
MKKSEFYSIRDLASLSGEAGSTVSAVVTFLAKYGFVEQLGSDEPVFKKSGMALSPGESVRLLKTIVNTNSAG